jgi:hypothetical protein
VLPVPDTPMGRSKDVFATIEVVKTGDRRLENVDLTAETQKQQLVPPSPLRREDSFTIDRDDKTHQLPKSLLRKLPEISPKTESRKNESDSSDDESTPSKGNMKVETALVMPAKMVEGIQVMTGIFDNILKPFHDLKYLINILGTLQK